MTYNPQDSAGLTVTSNVNANTTIGGAGIGQTSNCVLYNGYPWTYQTYPYPQTIGYYHVWPSEPTDCIGKAHVFECDHEPACKCGAVRRVMARRRK